MRLSRFKEPALKSCATCRHWRVEASKVWCPRAAAWLPEGKLVLTGCMFWDKEPRESYALELYEKLSST